MPRNTMWQLNIFYFIEDKSFINHFQLLAVLGLWGTFSTPSYWTQENWEITASTISWPVSMLSRGDGWSLRLSFYVRNPFSSLLILTVISDIVRENFSSFYLPFTTFFPWVFYPFKRVRQQSLQIVSTIIFLSRFPSCYNMLRFLLSTSTSARN